MRKKNLQKWFLLSIVSLAFMLFASDAEAQEHNVLSEIELGNYMQEWKMLKTMELADIFYKYSDCSDPSNGVYPERILFKVVNKTDNKVYVYWEYLLEYDNQPANASPNENLVQVHLEPNQSLEGNCDNLHQTKLGIFFRYKDQQTILTDFQLDDLNEYIMD